MIGWLSDEAKYAGKRLRLLVVLAVLSLFFTSMLISRGMSASNKRVIVASGRVEAQEAELSPQSISLEPIKLKSFSLKEEEEAHNFSLSSAASSIQSSLAPQPVGKVKRIAVSLGDEVEKGQLLVIIDNPLLGLQVKQAKAAVELLEATLRYLDETKEDLEAKLNEAEDSYAQAEEGLKEAQRGLLALRREAASQKAKAQSSYQTLLVSYEEALQEVADAEAAGWNDPLHPNYPDYLVLVATAQALEKAVTEAKAGLRVLEAEFAQAEVELESALAKLEEVIAQLRYGISYLESAINKLEKKRAVVEAQLKLARVTAEEAEDEEGKLVLRSPYRGFVTEQLAQEGEVVFARQPLLAIGKLTESRVRLYLPWITARFVRPGQRVKVYLDSYPGRAFKGVVIRVSPEVQLLPSNISTSQIHPSQTVEVLVKVNNPKLILKPGLPVDGLIEAGL